MTQPKSSPWRFHFIAGVEENRDVKSHLKRKYGWFPNQSRRSKRRAKGKR